MKETVQHIDIPFDEVGIFKVSDEDQYQNILIETLLLTTLGIIHPCKKPKKIPIFITTKSIFMSRKDVISMLLPINGILAVAKSHHHPEMVLITKPQYHNIRITTSTEQRCWYIVSALSYVFTYVHSRQLCFITINNSSLEYFERSSSQKMQGNDINIQPYLKQRITYHKPFKGLVDIYGHINPNAKIILERKMETQATVEDNNHTIHLAIIKHDDQSYNKQKRENKYICHYVDKKQRYLQLLYEHKNIEWITELVYAKTSDFKIQIFFEFSRSLRSVKMLPIIFKQIWELYDKVKQMNKKIVVTSDLFVQVSKKDLLGNRLVFQEGQDEQQQRKWNSGEYVIVANEFRYQFLNEMDEWNKFIYQQQQQFSEQDQSDDQQEKKTKLICKQQEDEQTSQNSQVKEVLEIPFICKQKSSVEYFRKKLYNIGMILYELVTGRHILSYTPAQINEDQVLKQQIQILYNIKSDIKLKRKIDNFPKFLCTSISESLQKFIEACIYQQFENFQEIQQHEWLMEKI